MIVYGRQVRDHLPAAAYKLQAVWEEVARKREESFLKRHYMNAERLERGARVLKSLKVGDHVYVQEQCGNSPKL